MILKREYKDLSLDEISILKLYLSEISEDTLNEEKLINDFLESLLKEYDSWEDIDIWIHSPVISYSCLEFIDLNEIEVSEFGYDFKDCNMQEALCELVDKKLRSIVKWCFADE